MRKANEKFSVNARKDYNAWKCDKMYPKPEEETSTGTKWLGGLTTIAKKGFQIYNMIKKFIPGGTRAGKGPVPGSNEEEMQLFDMPKVGFEEIAGLGSKLKTLLDGDDKHKKLVFQERLDLWKQAHDMCEDDKKKFAQSISAVTATIHKFYKPMEWTELKPFSADLSAGLKSYKKDVRKVLKNAKPMTTMEMTTAKGQLEVFEKDVIKGLKLAKKNGQDALKLKAALLK